MTLSLDRPTHHAPPSTATPGPASHFLFLSSCSEPWGGSEELWSDAARELASRAYKVTALKALVVRKHPRIAELVHAGIAVHDYGHVDGVLFARALWRQFSGFARSRLGPPLGSRRDRTTEKPLPEAPPLNGVHSWKLRYVRLHKAAFAIRVKSLRPDFAVISQSVNFDGIDLAVACRKIGVPYVLVCQKASDFYWPPDSVREIMQEAFRNASAVYFVSKHNRELTERQLAFQLPNAEIVRNPFLTHVPEALPYPDTESGRLRLACVARLDTTEKGQDTLLEVLSRDKWRHRGIELSFYGRGVHRIALEQAAAMHELPNVSFRGFTDDVTSIWKTHHALVLPSRCEGLPLVVVEAMLCGRPVIVTNAGGNAELVDDGETGFVARGTGAAPLDDALEFAWNRRADWERIGREAARRVRGLVPADPGAEFATKLTSVFNTSRERSIHSTQFIRTPR